MLSPVGERKKIADLRVGDRLLSLDHVTGQKIEDEVYGFGDYGQGRPDGAAIGMVRICTNATTHCLDMTYHHLLFTASGASVFAGQLDTTMVLRTMTGPARVTSIGFHQVREGYASPLTYSGTLLADDVLASSYATATSVDRDIHKVIHSLFAPLRWSAATESFFARWMPEAVYRALRTPSWQPPDGYIHPYTVVLKHLKPVFEWIWKTSTTVSPTVDAHSTFVSADHFLHSLNDAYQVVHGCEISTNETACSGQTEARLSVQTMTDRMELWKKLFLGSRSTQPSMSAVVPHVPTDDSDISFDNPSPVSFHQLPQATHEDL